MGVYRGSVYKDTDTVLQKSYAVILIVWVCIGAVCIRIQILYYRRAMQ